MEEHIRITQSLQDNKGIGLGELTFSLEVGWFKTQSFTSLIQGKGKEERNYEDKNKT